MFSFLWCKVGTLTWESLLLSHFGRGPNTRTLADVEPWCLGDLPRVTLTSTHHTLSSKHSPLP